MRADSDARGRSPIALAREGRSRAPMNNPASFLDNHIARNPHSAAIWKTATQHRQCLAIRDHSRTRISRRGRGRVCTSVRFWECGWEDLRDSCAAFLVFRVGSARTLMRKDAPPTMGTSEDTSPWRHTHHEGPTPIQATRHRGRRARLPHPNITPQETLPSSQESSTTPVGNGYRTHRAGGCGSCWCLHAGRKHQLMERSPQHRRNTHRAPSAHAISIE